ncbi:MAG: hypothetical protein J5511_01295 [Bacilli bacterium]|nr:hypothetical protein [Bacilli bacterium]
MIPSIILLVLGTIMSIVFIVSKVTNYSLKTIIFKTIASLFFVALGIVAFCLNKEGHFIFKLFTVLGLFFGMLGDLFLGFKYITTKTKKIWILLGMFAFAIGHICYILGLLIDFWIPGNTLFIILPFVLPVVIISIYMLVAKKVGINFGKGMLIFGLFYLYCLTTMVSSALCMAILYKFALTTLVMFLPAAICFCASDMMLTGAYFKEGQRSKAYMATYSVFYYIAQFVIAFSILFLI